MADTHVLLQKINVGPSGATSVTFTNIPQTGYTDLVLKVSAQSNQVNVGYAALRFNGSSTGYTQRILQGDGSSAAVSYTGVAGVVYALSASTSNANVYDSTDIYIPNYTTSNNKSVSFDNTVDNGTTSNSFVYLSAGLWANTDAITSITVYAMSSSTSLDKTFQQHSTFSLYGVSKSGVIPTLSPKAVGGDIIQTDGTYWYHAFKTSGSFTPLTTLSTDVLVVAGGGAGGGSTGGGGGAGGVCYQSGRSVSSSKTVIVGAGAASGGLPGNNSSFDTIIALGGGKGLSEGEMTGASGGSGGGGGRGTGTGSAGPGGSATQSSSGGATGYGNSGGNGSNTGNYNQAGGGGGGAGASGANASSGVGGNGGVGLNTWSTWATVTGTGDSGYYAGGGGGSFIGYNSAGTKGSGGLGGGGGGANSNGNNTTQNGTAGTANTGGGSGGGGNGGSSTGGAGGSGIVIVRYAV